MTGRLAVYAVGFRENVTAEGYRPESIANRLRLVAGLSCWMVASGVEVGDLSPQVPSAYLAARRRWGRVCLCSAKALDPLMTWLRAAGAVDADPTSVVGAAERLLGDYLAFLLLERALTAETAAGYVHAVRPFVAAHC